ncbi:MAG: thioredoxin domain-containing protein [Gammaproteobacteria bacterium]|nr:thioredoxin domain-containing protein [Gammaproteobacteria bacterium]
MQATDPPHGRNALAGETSPYLRQHAGNPVDWLPWGPEALARARELDRPILLSIGYSACHWCHVMAHESFEDPATAAVMNQSFVNIKVDREERPDLDRNYQIAHQVLTHRGGGWPLTMFLAPDDLTPFFAGTYFPKAARFGMPSFVGVLERVAGFYRTRRDTVREQNRALQAVFADLVPPRGALPARAPLDAARRELEISFDGEYGGFGSAPKFPHPTSIERLLRHWQATAATPEPDLQALFMATLTLKRMAEGGLYDQLGGGFCRYSVDRYWMIPHFEKMLYDNGPLLALAAQAAVATGDPFFREIALGTAGWALAEMQLPEGGFCAALDADSEGHEGRFYVWDRAEVEALLPADEFAVLARRYGLDREANFEGRWHLHCCVSLADVAQERGLAPDAAAALLQSGRARLLAGRSRRVRPGRDDKVLTAWNALLIRGLAISGRLLGEPAQLAAATRAVDFLRAQCWREGQLYAAWKDGQARFPAYLDDHAFLLDALLELLQARWRDADLDFACAVAEVLLERFRDRAGGGFWFTAAGLDPPLGRSRSFADEAMPSGNGVAALALARLGWLLGETRYLEAAEDTLCGGSAALERAPVAHTTLLNALDEWLDPVGIVVIRGAEAGAWAQALAPLYAPRRMVFAIPAAARLPPALAAKQPAAGTTAWICRGPQCSPPVPDLTQLVRELRDGIVPAPA